MKTNRYKETFDTWNNLASLYEEKFMHLDLYNETYDLVCETIDKPHAKILDIGCGPGNITKYLLNKRPDFEAWGIDVAKNMVELAKKNNPTAHFQVMDTRNINQLKIQVDGIICGFCLPYLSATDTKKLIVDCHQLLLPKGLLYLSFVEGNPKNSGFKIGSSGHRSYFYYHSTNKLQSLLAVSGFNIIKSFEVKYPLPAGKHEFHHVLIAVKIP